MGYYVECFKSFTLINSSESRYEFKMINSIEPQCLYPSKITKIDEYLETINPEIQLSSIIPNYGEINFKDITFDEASNILNRLKKPSECVDFIKANNIIESISTNKPEGYKDMLELVYRLMEYYNNGYYILIWY